MISEAEIVKAKINDIKKIIEIEELSYKDPWPREVFMIDFLFNSSSDYFVCRVKQKIVGFIGVWYEVRKLHVINVAVRPEERGKGIATAMLEFAIGLAKERKMEAVYLEARKSNTVAQGLYSKVGFVPKEELHGYYQDGEDGIRMELTLAAGDNL